MDITIRAGTAADFPALLELIHEFATFQKTPEKVLIDLEQMHRDEGLFQCFVAEAGDKIVGFASYCLVYFSWSGRALYLDDLYVQPAFRGQKLGIRLMDAVIAFAWDMHCRKVRWQVSRWNENAIAFYKSRGAQIDDVEINCDLWL